MKVVKFRSYDSSSKRELETEIRFADVATVHLFVQTWVPDYLSQVLKDPNFGYAFFKWDMIIKSSFIVGSGLRCYGAFTGTRLDGLLCLSKSDHLRVEYIAIAPWNYHTIGKMRRIGSALIFFTIRTSLYAGNEGEFWLNALPDAEIFYEKIGMLPTGNRNEENLKEYRMPKDTAKLFFDEFAKYLVEQ